jgi:hypothetical protein
MNKALLRRLFMNMRSIYALVPYTVERRSKGWFYTRSYMRGDKPAWRGPYRSEASVTLMIARELKREIARRVVRAA